MSGPAGYGDCLRRQLASIGLSPEDVLRKHDRFPIPSVPRQKVSPDPQVYEAQRHLKSLGYDPGPVNGYIGPRTRWAIEAFQRSQGLRSDGQINQSLINVLRTAVQVTERKRDKPTIAITPQFRWPDWEQLLTNMSSPKSQNNQSPAEVYDTVKNTVWVIIAGRGSNDFKKRHSLSQGSAIAVSSKHLLTNCHIIKDRPLIALVQGEDLIRARLTSADPPSDRCILTADEPNLHPVPGVRRFPTLKVGERVYTVGAPSGLERTLGEGIISGLRPTSDGRFIQTTAPISPGSSGGGLFDHSGNLIGITTFLLKEAQAINFAIAAEDYWR